jgi:hypothetical protein
MASVEPISEAEFLDLLRNGFKREAVHLETREAYGTAVELPYLARWLAGDPDDLAWLEDWCGTLREHVSAGRSVKRARIVSEPLCDYQRWSHSIAQPMVDAGEDIRWAPRHTLGSALVTANDFYLLDDALAIFLTYTGDGLSVDHLVSTDPEDLRRCRAAFDAVWPLAVPHGAYQPV